MSKYSIKDQSGLCIDKADTREKALILAKEAAARELFADGPADGDSCEVTVDCDGEEITVRATLTVEEVS